MKQEEKPEKAANDDEGRVRISFLMSSSLTSSIFTSVSVKPTTKPRKVAGKVCPICKKSFEGDTSHVNRHMKAVHYKIKDFKCDKCPYAPSRARSRGRRDDIKKEILIEEDTDEVMARVEADIPKWRSEKSEAKRLNNWAAFFSKAGVSPSKVQTYAAVFVKNEMGNDTLKYLDKESLHWIGITALGDIFRILQHAKKVVETDVKTGIIYFHL